MLIKYNARNLFKNKTKCQACGNLFPLISFKPSIRKCVNNNKQLLEMAEKEAKLNKLLLENQSISIQNETNTIRNANMINSEHRKNLSFFTLMLGCTLTFFQVKNSQDLYDKITNNKINCGINKKDKEKGENKEVKVLTLENIARVLDFCLQILVYISISIFFSIIISKTLIFIIGNMPQIWSVLTGNTTLNF